MLSNPHTPRPCGCNDGCLCPSCMRDVERKQLQDWIRYVQSRPDVPR